MADIVRRNPITVLSVPEGARCARRIGSWQQTCKRTAKAMAYILPSNQEPSPVCGLHAAGLTRKYQNQLDRDQREAGARARAEDTRRREAEANNLAQFLTDQLGIKFWNQPGGYVLSIDIDTARKLYQAKVVLAGPTQIPWRLT